ncbi:Hypothetical predicted protein [Octopus vulgaris]|uniref:Uncharacterized protein n=1 Tax=Octopus vulgaris TaxID=6645 RepID=A0AA36FJM4_OCTVU|nr:Hypothetical predicted protein [Octopus vulgaris]
MQEVEIAKAIENYKDLSFDALEKFFGHRSFMSDSFSLVRLMRIISNNNNNNDDDDDILKNGNTVKEQLRHHWYTGLTTMATASSNDTQQQQQQQQQLGRLRNSKCRGGLSVTILINGIPFEKR